MIRAPFEPPFSGRHICHLYHQVSELPEVMASVIREGLSHGEKWIVVAAPRQINELCEQLRTHQVEVEKLVETDQLVMLDTPQPSLVAGTRFDPYEFLSSHQRMTAQAVREGWQAVRLAIDMSLVTKESELPEQILRYEAASDAVFTYQNAPVGAIIHYEQSRLAPSLLAQLEQLHPPGDCWRKQS